MHRCFFRIISLQGSVYINFNHPKWNNCNEITPAVRVHGKTHTSDIRMIYKYIRVTYEWHTSDILTRMSLVCTRMLFLCHSCVLVFHSHVLLPWTRIEFHFKIFQRNCCKSLLDQRSNWRNFISPEIKSHVNTL